MKYKCNVNHTLYRKNDYYVRAKAARLGAGIDSKGGACNAVPTSSFFVNKVLGGLPRHFNTKSMHYVHLLYIKYITLNIWRNFLSRADIKRNKQYKRPVLGFLAKGTCYAVYTKVDKFLPTISRKSNIRRLNPIPSFVGAERAHRLGHSERSLKGSERLWAGLCRTAGRRNHGVQGNSQKSAGFDRVVRRFAHMPVFAGYHPN